MLSSDDEALSWDPQIPALQRHAYTLGARPLATTVLALAGVFAAVSTPTRWWTWLLLGGAIAAPVVSLRRLLVRIGRRSAPVQVSLDGTATGTFVFPRLVAGVGTLMLLASHGAGPGTLLSFTVLLALVLAEVPARVLLTRATAYAANITDPRITPRNWPRLEPDLLFIANSLALIMALVSAATGRGSWTIPTAMILVFALLVIMAGDGAARIRAQTRFTGQVRSYLESFAPVFVLHWEAPQNTAFQVLMWLPYLERLDLPFIIVLRDERNMRDVLGSTTAPIIVCEPLESLENILVPSLRAALYVNTATKNSHLARYPELTHIQLNHGDSDKTPSFNPVMRMYDKDFVAGQAAVDRFRAHGVDMSPSAFVIAGRPQVESIERPRHPIREVAQKSVLYAPTWEGFHADSRYSSLAVGEAIVTALVQRGCRVIFRPHPYSRHDVGSAQAVDRICAVLAADSGSAHVFGSDAEQAMSLIDCMNDSDALICDISSVVDDYLFSHKPVGIVAVHSGTEQFRAEFPVSGAAYIIEASDLPGTLQGALDQLLIEDPLAEQRVTLQRYYLGDLPVEDYSAHFIRQLRNAILPAA